MKSVLGNLAALLPAVALVRAQATSTASAGGSVQTVQVGQSGLVFEPNSITASEGDVIEFVIHPSHNVARSSFDQPCQPIGSGSQSIWSGDGLADGTIFSVTVNNTDPIWLYCATPGHCESGMAMAINPGSDTIGAYQSAASSASAAAPTEVAGGVYGAASATGSSTGSSASSTSSSASSTSRPASSSSTTSSAGASSTTNAARNVVADLTMVGGAMLGGAVFML